MGDAQHDELAAAERRYRERINLPPVIATLNDMEAMRGIYLPGSGTNQFRDRETLARGYFNLVDAVRRHHSQKADDRCWLDDNELYAAAGLPQADVTVGGPSAMLKNCERFVTLRMEGKAGAWRSYAELEEEITKLKGLANPRHADPTPVSVERLVAVGFIHLYQRVHRTPPTPLWHPNRIALIYDSDPPPGCGVWDISVPGVQQALGYDLPTMGDVFRVCDALLITLWESKMMSELTKPLTAAEAKALAASPEADRTQARTDTVSAMLARATERIKAAARKGEKKLLLKELGYTIGEDTAGRAIYW